MPWPWGQPHGGRCFGAAFLFLVGGNVLLGLPSPVSAQTLAGIGLGA